jgi:hypothetical protein
MIVAMTRWLAPWLAVTAMAACKQETIRVQPSDPMSDYGHTALIKAIDRFVGAGRTPEAFHALAETVTRLRPGMDEAVAHEAERKLLVLALDPVVQLKDQPIPAQVQALALTVWPTLLAPAIEADAILQVRDPKAVLYIPKPDETPDAYLQRLCGDPLKLDCKRVVPEYQGAVVDAIALRRATERVRNAITDCMECSGTGADAGWQRAIDGWAALDRAASLWIVDVEREADPDNWPLAGGAADEDPRVPEAELSARGDIVVNGHGYGPNAQRVAVMAELRGTGDVLELHIHPDTTLAQVRGALVDARKAGCAHVAVVAREGTYPWRRKAYWIADGSGLRANLRPTDSLQLLVHAIDEVAGPGTVARVD